MIATYQRIDYLRKLMISLEKAYSEKISELISLRVDMRVCVNGQDADTVEFLQSYSSQYIKREVVVLNEKTTPAHARNLVAQTIKADWILFLDDDVAVPIDFFKNFMNLSTSNTSIDVWGGPNLTPVDSSPVEQLIGLVLESFWIVGPVSFRYKFNNSDFKKTDDFRLSLCNLFIKTEKFKLFKFNPNLVTAEENELLYKLTQRKDHIAFSDLLYVWHYRRKSTILFLKQIRNYGVGRGQLLFEKKTNGKYIFLALLSSVVISLFFIKWPIAALILAIFWPLIFLKEAKRKTNTLLSRQLYVLPWSVWLNYTIGLVKGFTFQLKQRQ